MEIRTERLLLKPLGMGYFETVCQYSMDPENARYMVYYPKASCEEVEEFISDTEKEWKKEKPSYYEFAVILENVNIGIVSIYFDDSFECGELGWIIDKNYWGNGYAFEASKAIAEKYHQDMHINKFIAHCDSDNHASMRVMEKLGMHFVEKQGDRKNRASDEIREECLFEMLFER